MGDVTLSAAVRSSLLSLSRTTDLVNTTQNRLATGLKVSQPIDDPVAFFQSKSLQDRALDFSEKKDGIDQSISTVTAALDGVDGIENLVRQLKGLSNSMKSATTSQMSDLVSQFNDLRTQINNLAADASYQGTNLINGTGTTLSVEFSNQTSSQLTVSSVDLTVGTSGLSIRENTLFTAGNVVVDYGAYVATGGFQATGGHVSEGISTTGSISLTWQGAQAAYTAGSTISVTYGTQTLSVLVNAESTLNNGDVITVNVDTAAATSGYSVLGNSVLNFDGALAATTAAFGAAALTAAATLHTLTLTWLGDSKSFTTADSGISFALGTATVTIEVNSATTLTNGETFTITAYTAAGLATAGAAFSVNGGTSSIVGAITGGATATQYDTGLIITNDITANATTVQYVSAGDTTSINNAISELDAALTTLRTQASNLGSNVALLQTRFDFTNEYVNTLDDGASKLTLADLNEEGANLLALQTRQQLGIQSLSFAGQSEQAILSLFR
jgi:flagellin-like hook-associated protein FlgL